MIFLAAIFVTRWVLTGIAVYKSRQVKTLAEVAFQSTNVVRNQTMGKRLSCPISSI